MFPPRALVLQLSLFCSAHEYKFISSLRTPLRAFSLSLSGHRCFFKVLDVETGVILARLWDSRSRPLYHLPNVEFNATDDIVVTDGALWDPMGGVSMTELVFSQITPFPAFLRFFSVNIGHFLREISRVCLCLMFFFPGVGFILPYLQGKFSLASIRAQSIIPSGAWSALSA